MGLVSPQCSSLQGQIRRSSSCIRPLRRQPRVIPTGFAGIAELGDVQKRHRFPAAAGFEQRVQAEAAAGAEKIFREAGLHQRLSAAQGHAAAGALKKRQIPCDALRQCCGVGVKAAGAQRAEGAGRRAGIAALAPAAVHGDAGRRGAWVRRNRAVRAGARTAQTAGAARVLVQELAPVLLRFGRMAPAAGKRAAL